MNERDGKPGLLKELNFDQSDNLMRWLKNNEQILNIAADLEVLKFLSDREREILANAGTVLVIPLTAVNRLIGALFLGKRKSGKAYSAGEIETLTIFANQSALAIEHALVYQFHEDRLRKLFHADKLATIGELAAGAAHEIRNPLAAIRSTAQYVRKNLSDEKKGLVDGIIEEVDRIDNIIKGLLSFSKFSELQMGRVDVKELLDQTILLLDSETRKRNVQVVRKYEAADSEITGDQSQLKQVFLNILLNGIQAMPEGGILSVEAARASRQSENGLSEGSCGQDKVLRVEISDTGIGIPEELSM